MAIAQVDKAHVLSSRRFYKIFEKRHVRSMANCETMLGGNRPEMERDSPSKVLGDPREHGRELLFLGWSVPCNIEHEFNMNSCIDGPFYKGSTVLQDTGRTSQCSICFVGKTLEPDKQCIYHSR